jgi:hypothetical protein
MAKLPSLTDIINSVSESEYNQAMSTRNSRQAVFKDWNKFKTSKIIPGYNKPGGKGLTMVSGMDPDDDAFNAKIAKNATHPNSKINVVHEMGVSLAHADTSGIFDACAGCKTAECEKLCNAESGHGGIHKEGKDNAVIRAQKIRSAYWAENPQFAGALTIMQARKGASAARAEGLVPAIRFNMWSDVHLPSTTLAGPFIHDLSGLGKKDPEAIGAAKMVPMLTHTNYTKRTMNRVLRPGEKEFDADNPKNYIETGSISEQTPVKRVQQRVGAGKTAQAPVWATPSQVKPNTWTMQDSHGNRGTFKSYDADASDSRFLDEELGYGGQVGLLRHKLTPAFRESNYKAGPSSFVRPLDPDAPVGSPTGIPKKYARTTSVSISRKPSRKQLGND